jgi:hypothetical protein
MKKGDVVRIHVLRGRPCKPPVWGRATADDTADILVYDDTTYYAENFREDPYDWAVDKTSPPDSWRVVPEDKVPDYVWAAIAREALLGEDK